MLQHGAISAETRVMTATAAAEKPGATTARRSRGWRGRAGGVQQNPVGTIHIAPADRAACGR